MVRTAALLLLAAILGGCASAKLTEWEIAQAEPRPESWNPGSIWTLVLVDQDETIIRTLTVRFTDEIATKSCIGGDWKKLEILTERPPRPSGLFAEPEPAYWTEGSLMMIDLTANFCDNYTPLLGRLTAIGLTGEHGTEHMLGGETIGRFYGAPVQ